MLPFTSYSRRIRNIVTPLRGYTTSDPAIAGPPSPQGEGFGGIDYQLVKLQFACLAVCGIILTNLGFAAMMNKKGGVAMSKTVDTKEYLDMVCELLQQGQTHVPVPVAGSSMTPFLHNGDTVYLDLSDSPLKRADIVLYTRPDGRYILHRIVQVNSDGSFIMMGDAQQEREWIESERQIHARVTSAVHRGKPVMPGSLRWRFFETVWLWVIPCRRRILSVLIKILNKNR